MTETQPVKFKYEQKALAEHERMSCLFRENRFLFERERQKAIEETINKVKKKRLRKELQERQAQWDNILKHAGSIQTRLVLMEMMFWDAINSEWLPAIEKA